MRREYCRPKRYVVPITANVPDHYTLATTADRFELRRIPSRLCSEARKGLRPRRKELSCT